MDMTCGNLEAHFFDVRLDRNPIMDVAGKSDIPQVLQAEDIFNFRLSCARENGFFLEVP